MSLPSVEISDKRERMIALAQSEFRFHSCSSGATIVTVQRVGNPVVLPAGTGLWRGFLLEAGDPRIGDTADTRQGSNLEDALVLLAGTAPPVSGGGWPKASPTNECVLDKTPGYFRLLFPHQYSHPIGQSFFFMDQRWVFFAERLPDSSAPITQQGARDLYAIDEFRTRFLYQGK